MPESFRDIVAHGDLILPGLPEGVFLRIGKNGKVDGLFLSLTDIPSLPIAKINLLAELLGKKVEKINNKTGVEISLTASDVGAIASDQNLADIPNILPQGVSRPHP